MHPTSTAPLAASVACRPVARWNFLWSRFVDAIGRHRHRMPTSHCLSESDWRLLRHLDDDTLRDIGAPPWLRARDCGLSLSALERARW